MQKPMAYDSTEEKKGKEILLPAEVLWDPHSYHVYIHFAPALASPAFVASKNLSAASVYRQLDSRSLTDVLLGFALACLTLKPKPFLLLKGSRVTSPLPEAFPTAVHNSLISFVDAVHSLKRCSRLCLPFPHRQHVRIRPRPLLLQKGGYQCMAA